MGEHEMWWEVRFTWRKGPKPVKITKVTEKTVTVLTDIFGKPRAERHARYTQHTSYYPTWAEAKAAYVESRRDRLEMAKRELDTARNLLRDAEALREPPHE